MKSIKYDRHARRRMKWRKISNEEVENVLKSPDKIEQTEKGRINAFKIIGDRHLKVTYREFDVHILVISAVDKKG